MKINDIEEHEDGSATISFHIESKEVSMLLEVALTVLIAKEAVSNYKKTLMDKTCEELDTTD
jgi:hypothetical protein